MAKVALPVQVARGPHTAPLRIRDANDAPGGWTIMECDSVAHAREVMRRYPSAAMPCWRRPDLFEAEERIERAAAAGAPAESVA